MSYPNGDLTLDEQVDQHMENKAIGKEMSACWDEGYAEGIKAVNADLLAALQAAIPALDMLATEEARHNKAPNGQPDRTAARDRAHNARAAIAKVES